MPTVNVNTLLPQVSPFVGRCPQNLQLWALRTAARQFLIDTEMLEETLADIASVADQEDYTLISEYTNMGFKRVVAVYYHQDGAAYDKTGEVLPSDYEFDGNTTLTLDPAPEETGYDIQVTVIYEPTMDCVIYPDYIISRYGPNIASGALYYLRRDPIDPNEPAPWFSVQGADIAKGRYDDGVGDAKRLVLSRNQSGRVDAVEMRDFA